MKHLFRVIVFLGVCVLLIACGQLNPAMSSPISLPTITATTFTPTPSQTATATIESTSRPIHVPPTLIPTINPTLVPELLSKAISVQTLKGVNGHNIRQITGWEYGFGGGYWTRSLDGYYWLDAHHILLYPAAGQVGGPEGYWAGINVVPQSIVLNLESGYSWFPPATRNNVYGSQELGMLVTSEVRDDISTVSTYTYDGIKLSTYPGDLKDFSPSRTKILVGDNTLIDLQTNKKINLAWSLEDYQEQVLSGPFWTSDETRIYRCCYFYADLVTGISHRFERSDFHFTNGTQLDPSGLWFQNGSWVRDDKYFLVEWSYIDDGDIRYLPMFDPATKLFYDVREMAGIPEDFTSIYTPVSPDGNYVWMEGWNESYLVNLTTFQSQHYTYSNPYSYTDIDWSSNSKYTWFEIYDPDTKSTEFSILSIPDMQLHPLPIVPESESEHWWHPTDNLIVYPAREKNALIFLDVSTMSFQELSFKNQETPFKVGNLAWSPNGDTITFATGESSLWQVDYPKLESLEQMMSYVDEIYNVQWSPDGNSITFESGSDIFIIDTMK